MNRKAQVETVADYLAALPEDRRKAISTVRSVVNKNLPKGFVECVSYGMIGWVVPFRHYPAGYHANPKQPLPFANLGSQKHHMVLHLMTGYQLGGWLQEQFAAAGKKLDMGKACIRFKALDDLPLPVIGEAVGKVSMQDYIAFCEANVPQSRKRDAKKPGT